ncbi:MAG TPA: DUF4252 domain-containing protein, partial [Saprospiraceae bacterium]|nr:DUF4252 domain-containing protein [Saprospiraceae bacterium]
QSGKIFEDHLKKYPEVGRKYIYKSVLRLANVKDDPDYNKLIKDIRKIIIYSPPSNDTTHQVKDLRGAIRSGGYEELMDVRTANRDRINLFVNESLPKPHYIGLLETSSEEYILEIDGQINLEYVSALDMIDQKSLLDLLN